MTTVTGGRQSDAAVVEKRQKDGVWLASIRILPRLPNKWAKNIENFFAAQT
jgi:hypothetical protein